MASIPELVARTSLDHNPPNADIHVSTHGTDWLWAVFAIEAVSMLGMFGLTFMRPRGTRFFHNIALIMLTVSTIAYFAMASDLGATPIQTEFRAQGTRQIWYVRYIQWFINFPLLLTLLLFTTGLALSDILTTLFFSWVIVVSGLVGALVASSYKWGFFLFGLVSFFWIWAFLFGHGLRSSFAAGAAARTGFLGGSAYFVLITLLYPLCWALAEGGNVISVTSEMVWYGVLDLLLGPFFLYLFIFSLRGADYEAFGLQSWKYSDTAAGVGAGAIGGAAAGRTVGAGATPAAREKEAEAGITRSATRPGSSGPGAFVAPTTPAPAPGAATAPAAPAAPATAPEPATTNDATV
ncbi:hypothetical protein EIP86_000707 [Pleurotus ostreatoroseus]|nr:hypothetical protein EIP86_000707 [Pleurotus ostreatoroseus]